MPKEQLNYNHYQMYEIRFYFRQKYIHEQTKQTKIKGKKGRKKVKFRSSIKNSLRRVRENNFRRHITEILFLLR